MNLTILPSVLRSWVVVFRVDASLQIGSGHVMRCLTLAAALRKQGAQCHFLCREHAGHLCHDIESRGFRVHRLPVRQHAGEAVCCRTVNTPAHTHWLGTSWEQDAEECGKVLAQLNPTLLVVDHYALEGRWESAVLEGLPNIKPRLMVVDDLADRYHIADLLLDQNLGRRVKDYLGLVPGRCQVLVGPGFSLLRPEFAQWRETSLARRVRQPGLRRLLISLGGVDKNNVTGAVLDALKNCDLTDEIQITVVMGAAAPWKRQVTAQVLEMPWPVEVLTDVNDMARRMAEADFAVGAAGSTSWERCCLGLPTLMVVLAENQKFIATHLEHQGAAGILDNESLQVTMRTRWDALTSPLALTRMSARAAALVDGKGTDRVIKALSDIISKEKR